MSKVRTLRYFRGVISISDAAFHCCDSGKPHCILKRVWHDLEVVPPGSQMLQYVKHIEQSVLLSVDRKHEEDA